MATAHLEWNPQAGIQQEVRYKKASDSTFTLFQTVPEFTSTIDIPNLDPNTAYEFLVINKCNFGLEASSNLGQAAIVTCPGLSVEQGALYLTVSFTHVGGEVNQYTFEWYEMPGETLVDQVTITAPPGGTSYTYSGLQPDTFYKIKVIPKINSTYQNTTCEVTERTLGCAPDYTLAPDGSYCYKIEEVAATPPSGGTPENTVAATHNSYGTFGTYIYDFGFNTDGTGISTQIPTSNSFWINGLSDSSSGPLNRCGLWTSSELSDQDIGFSVCIEIPETKVYYIGVGGDNSCRIVIDGVVWVDQNVSALAAQYSTDAQVAFKIWHVYPVTLSSGPHIIELIGHNVSGDASLGAEIYNNTVAEITAATSYGQLTLVFSTKDYIGQPVQLSTDGLGYTCPSGYSLAACQDPIVCRRILTILPS